MMGGKDKRASGQHNELRSSGGDAGNRHAVAEDNWFIDNVEKGHRGCSNG